MHPRERGTDPTPPASEGPSHVRETPDRGRDEHPSDERETRPSAAREAERQKVITDPPSV